MSEDGTPSDPETWWDQRHDLSVSTTTTADIDARADGPAELVLLADITAETVLAAFDTVRDRCKGFDCLATPPLEYLHVTVKVFDRDTHPAPPTPSFRSSLDSALEPVAPCTIGFPRLNLFPSVVYAEVSDDDWFGHVNDRVCRLPAVTVMDRDEGFIPHVTLGQFTQREGYSAVVGALETRRDIDVPSVTVDTLQLVAVDHSQGRYPPFEVVDTYYLD